MFFLYWKNSLAEAVDCEYEDWCNVIWMVQSCRILKSYFFNKWPCAIEFLLLKCDFIFILYTTIELTSRYCGKIIFLYRIYIGATAVRENRYSFPFIHAVHLWRYSGGFDAIGEANQKMSNLKWYREMRQKRSHMLLARRNQLLFEFSFWNSPDPRPGPSIYELRSYQLKVCVSSLRTCRVIFDAHYFCSLALWSSGRTIGE